MGSYIREIATLQIGHYSNFIGAHWLNLQEASFVYDNASSTDINHDYLFREGRLPNNQDCYVPRILIIDAKGSLGSLPRLGTLYESPFGNPSTSEALWSGDVQFISQTPEEKNDFLKSLESEDAKYAENLDEDKDICYEDCSAADTPEIEQKVFDLSNKVNVWSDFLRPLLHPKSIYLLDDVLHQNIGASATGEGGNGWGFQCGADVMKKETTEDEIFDRIRLLAESCGSLQGFHLLCDGHNGMGGVGAMVAQHLADDYSSKDVISFVSTPPQHKPKTSSQINVYFTNIIQSYTELGKYSSMLVPLNLGGQHSRSNPNITQWPYVSFNEMCPFESSSVFGSFLETVSVPWRTKEEAMPLSHTASVLTPLQRKVIGGCFSFPIGLEEDGSFFDWIKERDLGVSIDQRMRFKSVSSDDNITLHKVAELSSIRGISNSMIRGGLRKYNNAWHLYEEALREEDSRTHRCTVRHVSGIRDALKTNTPFPQIFSKEVNSKGFLKTTPENTSSIVTSTPSVASIYQGDGVANSLRKIQNVGSKIDVTKLSDLAVGGLERDVWKNAFEDFMSLVGCYRDSTNRDSNQSDSD